MTALLLVVAGGGIGAGMRHLVNMAALRLLGPAFPWHTVAVNLLGGLLMGLLVGLLARHEPAGGANHIRLFLATGVLGGFTTFSAFSLDAVVLWERGTELAAAGYVLGSVAGAIAALMAGLALVRLFG
jgi:CrcB protein